TRLGKSRKKNGPMKFGPKKKQIVGKNGLVGAIMTRTREEEESPVSRSERQQSVRRRSPAPDPNSMVDWEKRSKNVQSQLWIVNQRIDRERRARDIEVQATRQAIESVVSGGDVNMSAPPTGPRPGGRSRQKQDLREQRERWTRG
ncbi:hypothetical protein KC316_g8762, partial [Hortaea werneckii]